MNRTHIFLTVNKHMMKSGAPPADIWFPIEFHGFTSRINAQGYHSLVPGLISIFLETIRVPLKHVCSVGFYCLA